MLLSPPLQVCRRGSQGFLELTNELVRRWLGRLEEAPSKPEKKVVGAVAVREMRFKLNEEQPLICDAADMRTKDILTCWII